MAKGKNIFAGILLLIVFSTLIYVNLPDQLRIKIEKTKSSFYIWENNSWLLTGTEYNFLYNGSRSLGKQEYSINYSIINNVSTIKRIVNYTKGTIIDTYIFDGNDADKTRFPVSHTVEILNAKGFNYQYEVRDLYYSGLTISNIKSPQLFGKNMKIEWNDTNYYSKITKLINGKGKLTIKYKITSDNQIIDIRLFDPMSLQNYTYYRNLSINSTITTNVKHIPILLNGTLGFNNGSTSSAELTWFLLDDLPNHDVNGTAICYYNLKSDYICLNSSDNFQFTEDVEEGLKSYSISKAQALWFSDYVYYVFHFNNSKSNATGGFANLIGSIDYNSSGLVGYAGQFKTITSTLKLGDVVFGPNGTTIEFWVKLNETPTVAGWVWGDWVDGQGRSSWMQINTTNGISGGCGTAASGSGWETPTKLDLNKWYYIVMTGSPTQLVDVYVNGVVVDTHENTYCYLNEIAGNAYIGSREGVENTFISGLIDEFRIRNTTMTADEVKARYETLSPSFKKYNILGPQQYAVNQPPVIQNISITPLLAYTDSTLNCSAQYGDNELDKGNISVYWYNGSELYGYATYLNLNPGDVVSNSTVSGIQIPGEIWNCTINATDAMDKVSAKNSTIRGIIGTFLVLPFWFGVNDTANINPFNNITIELESNLNMTLNQTESGAEICIISDNPTFTTICSSNKDINFQFNISYFRGKKFADGDLTKNLSYFGPQNQTINITAHNSDDIFNLSINLTGYVHNGTYPMNIKVYINGTLSNSFPIVPGSTGFVDLDSLSNFSSIKNITFGRGLNTQIEYLYLPKQTIVSDALINLSGYRGDLMDNQSDGINASDSKMNDIVGIASNGTDFWVLNYGDSFINHFNSSWDNQTDGFNITGIPPYPFSMTFNGSDFWVIYWDAWLTNQGIIRYNLSGDVVSTGEIGSFGCLYGDMGYGITTNNSDFWVTMYCAGNESANKYIHHLNSSYDHISGGNIRLDTLGCGTYTSGLITNNSDFWIFCDDDDFVYHTNLSGYNFSDGFPAGYAGKQSNLAGITFNNISGGVIEPKDFWITDHLDDFIYHFNKTHPFNPFLEVGIVNGTHEWNYSGIFNIENNLSSNFSNDLNYYLRNCTADEDGFCNVPLYFTSISSGIIQISDISIDYAYDINPVVLDKTLIQNFVGNSTEYVNIPINISSTKNGTIEIKDIRFDYAGGNSTINLLAKYTYGPTLNISINITNFFSKWNFNFPSNVWYLEFIPKNSNSKNVTPYGQTNATPIFNITTYNYGSKNMNLSIFLNSSITCVNLTISNNSNKANGFLLTDTWNNTWRDFNVNLSYLNNTKLWMWADYNCTSTTWQLFQPALYIRGCCYGCEVCSEETH